MAFPRLDSQLIAIRRCFELWKFFPIVIYSSECKQMTEKHHELVRHVCSLYKPRKQKTSIKKWKNMKTCHYVIMIVSHLHQLGHTSYQRAEQLSKTQFPNGKDGFASGQDDII